MSILATIGNVYQWPIDRVSFERKCFLAPREKREFVFWIGCDFISKSKWLHHRKTSRPSMKTKNKNEQKGENIIIIVPAAKKMGDQSTHVAVTKKVGTRSTRGFYSSCCFGSRKKTFFSSSESKGFLVFVSITFLFWPPFFLLWEKILVCISLVCSI